VSRVPKTSIKVVSNIHILDPTPADFRSRSGVVFTGNFNHLPNRDAIIFFAQEILPIIHPKVWGTISVDHSFIHSFIRCYSFIHSFIHSFVVIHSLLFIHTFIHSFIRCYSCTNFLYTHFHLCRWVLISCFT
jgi:hypothetical protein